MLFLLKLLSKAWVGVEIADLLNPDEIHKKYILTLQESDNGDFVAKYRRTVFTQAHFSTMRQVFNKICDNFEAEII